MPTVKELTVEELQANMLPFAKLMGIQVTKAEKDLVEATLEVRAELCTRPEILHGGAVMAFADTLGAMGTVLNLPDDAAGTTTIESKTNFMRAAPAGTTVTGRSTPIHLGRRTQVWQTRIETAEGKLVALVTQTQMVL